MEAIRVYQPDNSLRDGYLLAFKQIYDELVDNRWLMYQLFRRDFSTMYKQSLIGFSWIFIIPVVNVAIFAVLGHSGIFNFGKLSAPYPVYAILGLSLWQIFSNGVMACGNSLTLAGEMLTRINFSKKSLVIAAIGRAIISFTVQLLLIVVVLAAFKVVPSTCILLFPVVAVPIVIFTVGLGLIVSLLNSIIRDTGNFLSVIMMLGMYATPVLYAKPLTGLLSHISSFNPMYYFIASGRDLALTGHLTEPKGFFFSCLSALLTLMVGLVVFHLTETRITERI